MRKNMRLWGVSVAVLTIAAVGLGLFWPPAGSAPGRLYAQQTLASQAAQQEVLLGAERLSDAFRSAAKVLRPSVVTITSLVERSPQRYRRGRSFGFGGLPEEFRGMVPDEFLDEFDSRRGSPYEEDEYDRREDDSSRQKVQTGVGSGVIVSPDGYILTNNHVVAQADELQVELSDSRTFKATVVGTDAKSDVAVLKINAGNLVAAQLGDSSAMEVGDWVIAVGSPFGLDQTVTAGIISATNRQTGILSSRNGGGYEDFLQTDAAINPGNSGGPLVNLRGEVIGINTAINSRTGTNAGVGFAIPANMAARIMEDLQSKGRVVRGFIGALLDDVTSENAAELKLPKGLLRGAVIERVLQGQPAARASIRPKDVVAAMNGRPITSSAEFRNMVALTRPGSQLNLEVYREGRPISLTVVVGELTDDKVSELSGRVSVPSLEMTVETLPPQTLETSQGEMLSGVVVTGVDRQGKAAQLGVRPGDVILEFNGQEIADSKDFAKLVESSNRDLRMLVLRGNRIFRLQLSSR